MKLRTVLEVLFFTAWLLILIEALFQAIALAAKVILTWE